MSNDHYVDPSRENFDALSIRPIHTDFDAQQTEVL